MGLLQKAEEKRGGLLKKLTEQNKQYIDHISKKRREVIRQGIKLQRKNLGREIKIRKKIPLKRRSSGIKDFIPPQPAFEKELASLKTGILPQPPIRKDTAEYIFTGIPGFDDLLEKGIPRRAAVLIAGGAGSGKTIFGLQTAYYHASRGDKCLYISFEESEENLKKHLKNFGWNPDSLIKRGRLIIKRLDPLEIVTNVEALLMKAQGELLIKLPNFISPKGHDPQFIIVDSLTAISSAFTEKEESYRIYIEKLFRFFEEIRATSFLITETEQVPNIFSASGVEEFLADAVVVLYNIRSGNIRERALEVLKLRGASHQNRIVAMNIDKKGIEVFPHQEVFGEVEKKG